MFCQTLNAVNLYVSPCYVSCADGDRCSERENTWGNILHLDEDCIKGGW